MKKLFAGADAKQAEIESLIDQMKDHGFSTFGGQALVWEELGYHKDDWPDVVDNLVKVGLPENFADTLKLAAKSKRGSHKVYFHSMKENGVRRVTYFKAQVLPSGDDQIDSFIAAYVLHAVDQSETMTSVPVEQAFKRFTELDAARQWKSEVHQFMLTEPPANEE